MHSPTSIRSTSGSARNGCSRPTVPAGRPKPCARSQQLRRSLTQELGVDPSPEIIDLEHRMLDHDPGLRSGAPHYERVEPDPSESSGTGADIAARAVPTGAAPPVYEDALRSVRASSDLKLGLATVAVLITDLVGSTQIRTSIGHHRADEIERRHEGVLTRAVADYRGTIVKRLGDGAMAVFTTATDAVAAAGAIQTRLAGEREMNAPALQTRIGVSAGEVVVEADDVRGLPPTEAARLCARASGGQILTTQLVQQLAGGAQCRRIQSVRRVRAEGVARARPTVRGSLADRRR